MTNQLIFLGTSNAVPDAAHENTHMLLQTEQHVVLIDCPGSPLRRLAKAGVDPLRLTDLIVTHFHPDHVSGLPLLLMDLWLIGRQAPLHVHGLDYTLDRIQQMMKLHDWQDWPGFFDVVFHRLPESELTPVITAPDLLVQASPMRHFIPNIGLRIAFGPAGVNLAYSCDTEPCPQAVRLGTDVDVLIHEASGALAGHSSAEQAGETAQQARAASLYLIHYPTWSGCDETLPARAKTRYKGPVFMAQDMMRLEF